MRTTFEEWKKKHVSYVEQQTRPLFIIVNVKYVAE